MSTRTRWSGVAALFGLVLATAAPQGGGCGGPGGECGDHCGGSGGATSTGSTGSGPVGAGLTILAVTSNGDGCPAAGAVQAWYTSSQRTVTLTYPPFSISKSSPGFDHSSCATGLTVKGVPGWQFAATGAGLHGDADLPSGAKVRLETNVFFAGIPASAERDVEIAGPKSGSFDDTGTFPSGSTPWSPCGQDAIFNVQIGESIQSSVSDPASLELQSVTLPIAWREC